MIIKHKEKDGPINWMDQIKQAQDPQALYTLYIRNLKEELKVLQTEAKLLKQKLGIYDYNSQNKQNKQNNTPSSQLNAQQHKIIPLGDKPSDFAKYPTSQKFSSIIVNDQAFGSSAVQIEYIRELELLVEAIKQQNKLLHQQVSQLPQSKLRPNTAPKRKFEGHDMIDSKIITQKSQLVKVHQIHQEPFRNILKADNTLQDRMIQNLMEEKQVLEQEIQIYKQSSVTRKNKSKMEGFDFKQHIKIHDKNSVVYGAKMKYIEQPKKKAELEEKYLQALLQETFLLQQQLQKLQEENKIKTHKSVQGIVICNNDGQIIRSTYGAESKEGENIARTIPTLAAKAKSTVRDLDQDNKLTFLRIKSKKNEIMVAPDEQFMLIVVQGPKEDKKDDAE